MFISKKPNTQSWLVLIIDLIICFISIMLAYLLRFNFNIPPSDLNSLPRVVTFLLLVRSISFLFSEIHLSILKYTSTKDAVRIFFAIAFGSLLFVIANYISSYIFKLPHIIPFSIVVIDFVITVLAMTSYRLVFKIIYLEMYIPSKAKTNVIIFGAGEAGFITKRALDRDAGTKYKVMAFIDEDSKKIGKTVEGTNVYAIQDLEKLLEKNNIAHVILAVQNLNQHKKKEIIELCLNYNTKVLNVPPVSRWINGELSFKQIKKINIEDLLEREEIKLDEDAIRKQILGKHILITGAAGSIGSELTRQIARFSPKKIILLDQAETPLYHIELELSEKYDHSSFDIVMGDIRNGVRMEKLFKTFMPQIVYHAAAYKHVPMMENNPSEAVLTNVEGTKIIADLSIKYNIEKFVMVSTDKAVNPTSVMGASKRIAEIYAQSLNNKNKTKFITTRFGNVLGSNGSVIPLFRKQIDKGGPITITHPEVTRYFMTIPESCQLVLEAGALGNGGEIFIFDMGKSVKIVDLAKKMIKLSGLTLGKDIQIIFTGLRPGEKLYEELLNVKENTIPTHHPQIMIAKVQVCEYETINKNISDLIELFHTQNNIEIVKKMKQIVPEFKSNHSEYEKIDLNLI
jgi:FlaA1/EpsC-like NDP-sugar epimerase